MLRGTVFARGSWLLWSAKRKFCEVNTCGIEEIKPFTISTSKTNGLKPPEMNTYAKKCRGECTLCRSAGFIGSSPSCSSGRPAHSLPGGRPEAFGFVIPFSVYSVPPYPLCRFRRAIRARLETWLCSGRLQAGSHDLSTFGFQLSTVNLMQVAHNEHLRKKRGWGCQASLRVLRASVSSV